MKKNEIKKLAMRSNELVTSIELKTRKKIDTKINEEMFLAFGSGDILKIAKVMTALLAMDLSLPSPHLKILK